MTRITSRFAMLIATAAVLPLVVYGVVSLWSLRTGTQRSVREGNLNVATRVGEQIHLYITNNVNVLKALGAELRGTHLEAWQQDRILKNYVLDFPEFRELTLFDLAGTPIATSRRVVRCHVRTAEVGRTSGMVCAYPASRDQPVSSSEPQPTRRAVPSAAAASHRRVGVVNAEVPMPASSGWPRQASSGRTLTR